MAADRNENKRVKVGLAIFGLLVLANVFVHGGRMLKNSAPPPVKSASKPVANAVSVVPAAVTSDNLSSLITDGPAVFIEKQTGSLNESLSKLKKRFEKIPAMNPEPDLKVNLELNGNDYFIWKPAKASEHTVASKTFSLPEKSLMSVSGTFHIGNKTKLLVRSASTTYVVEPDPGGQSKNVTFISEDGEVYVVKDKSGISRVIQQHKSSQDRLEKAVDTLLGRSGQHEYRLISPTVPPK